MNIYRHTLCKKLVGVSGVSKISDVIDALTLIKEEHGDLHMRVGETSSAIGLLNIQEGYIYSGMDRKPYKELQILNVCHDPELLAFKQHYYELPTLQDNSS